MALNFRYYYAFYKLTYGRLIDDILFLLLGITIGLFSPENLPTKYRRTFVCSILAIFLLAIIGKILFYLSPTLITLIFSKEAFKENLALLNETKRYETEASYMQSIGCASLLPTIALLLSTLLIFICKVSKMQFCEPKTAT